MLPGFNRNSAKHCVLPRLAPWNMQNDFAGCFFHRGGIFPAFGIPWQEVWYGRTSKTRFVLLGFLLLSMVMVGSAHLHQWSKQKEKVSLVSELGYIGNDQPLILETETAFINDQYFENIKKCLFSVEIFFNSGSRWQFVLTLFLFVFTTLTLNFRSVCLWILERYVIYLFNVSCFRYKNCLGKYTYSISLTI